MRSLWTAGIAIVLTATVWSQPIRTAQATYSHGAIIRLDTTERTIHLVFTAHEFASSGPAIRTILQRHHIRASFFFTGAFYRTVEFAPLIRELKEDGHYLGPHSNGHLLYCDWSKRDSLLVTKAEFLRDLDSNFAAIASFGIPRADASVFLPPYEWYNDTITAWCRDAGLTLVNFTPGTSSNADYTWPALGQQYLPTDSIFQRILRFEASDPHGLNGFILLIHFGVDPRRPDPFVLRLDEMLTALETRGYRFERF